MSNKPVIHSHYGSTSSRTVLWFAEVEEIEFEYKEVDLFTGAHLKGKK